MAKKLDQHEHHMVIVAVIGIVAILAMFLIFITNQTGTQVETQEDLAGQAVKSANPCDDLNSGTMFWQCCCDGGNLGGTSFCEEISC